jgi:hypothetical protein
MPDAVITQHDNGIHADPPNAGPHGRGGATIVEMSTSTARDRPTALAENWQSIWKAN